MPATPPSDPWERLPRETDRAWQAFVVYRDMGANRSVRKTAATLHKSATLVGRWSSVHRWRERVAAWDVEQDRQERAEWQRARRDAAKRHARLAQALQAKIVERLGSLRSDEITAAQLGALLDVAVRVERQAYGEPDVTVSGPAGGPIEIAPLTADERAARIRALDEEIAARRASLAATAEAGLR